MPAIYKVALQVAQTPIQDLEGLDTIASDQGWSGDALLVVWVVEGDINIRHLRPTCGIHQRYTSDLAGL